MPTEGSGATRRSRGHGQSERSPSPLVPQIVASPIRGRAIRPARRRVRQECAGPHSSQPCERRASTAGQAIGTDRRCCAGGRRRSGRGTGNTRRLDRLRGRRRQLRQVLRTLRRGVASRLGAHHVPDLAFTVLQAMAGAAGILVVAGALLAVPAFVRFLRTGGWRLRAWALPASPHLYGLDHRRDSAPCRMGQPPPIASTQRWYPLERGSVPGVDSPHRHHLDIVDRGGGCSSAGESSSPRRRSRRRRSGRRRCCRNGDHGRCHCGLVGRNGHRTHPHS